MRAPAMFEVYQDRRAEWRWRLRHRNGNVVAESGEGYRSKAGCQRGLASVSAAFKLGVQVKETAQ